MNIAYITKEDPTNRSYWSGTSFFIYQCLINTNNNVICLGPLNDFFRIFFILIEKFFSLFNIKYDSHRSIFLSKFYAFQIRRKLKKYFKKIDIIIVHQGTLVSFLHTDIPIVIWTDATFNLYSNSYYKNFTLHKNNFNNGNYLESLSLNKAQNIIYSSKWAVNDAINFYNIPRTKIIHIPFGANFLSLPIISTISKNILRKKKSKICKLITIGVDWKRKGINKSIEVVKRLNDLGLKSTLNIIGVQNKDKKNYGKNILIYDYIDKKLNEGEKKISQLLLKAHFFLLLSDAETFGIVYAEASAHGLPSLANDINGVSSVVKNKVNGILFDTKDSPEFIAKNIYKLFINKKKYEAFAFRSYNYYLKNLDWNKISVKLSKEVFNKYP